MPGGVELLEPPVQEHTDAVGHGKRLFQVMGDADGGNAKGLLGGADEPGRFHFQVPVQVGKGLIQQQHGWVHDHGPGNGCPLLLAGGQLGRILVCMGGQLKIIQHSVHLFGDLRFFQVPGLEPETDIVPHGHGGKQHIILEHDDYRVVPVHGFGKEHFSRIRGVQAGDDVEQGGFARPGRPHNGDQFAGLDVTRDVFQNSLGLNRLLM